MNDAASRLFEVTSIDSSPHDFVRSCGDIFAMFDQQTQDSGNVSFGVQVGVRRYFIKTAGAPSAAAFLTHPQRVELLLNAEKLAGELADPVLPSLLNSIASPHGPVLVYEWLPGELLRVPGPLRSEPSSSYARFRALPLAVVCEALTSVFRVHAALAARGWIAGDFYDGSLLYDFAGRRIYLIDIDHYRSGPFVNTMGRMFGSSRFMAPEELTFGAHINERTTVLNLGRCITEFLHTRCCELGHPAAALLKVEERACQTVPAARFASVKALYQAWLAAIAGIRTSKRAP